MPRGKVKISNALKLRILFIILTVLFHKNNWPLCFLFTLELWFHNFGAVHFKGF